MAGELQVGSTLDRRWVLRRVIAHADHATVYEATHAFLDRVASIVVGRPEQRERLLDEASARDRTYHPGVLGVLDVCDTRDGTPYLAATPFVGRSLDGLLMARGALPPDEAVGIIVSVGEALMHVHSLGMAHAALSPGTILVDGLRAVLLDLGIFPTPLGSLSGPLASMPYTAPERLTSGALASRLTDVYAVAAIFAEMLSGEPPEEWPPSEGSFPAPLAKVVDRGLDDAGRRFESMEAFVDAVRVASAQAVTPSQRPSPRRRHQRVAYVSAVRARLSGDATLDGRTENICEGGLLILGSGSVAPGDTLLVRLALPTSGRIVSEPATVRWARGDDGQSKAFGVSFDDPAERTLEEIRGYVALFEDAPESPS